MATTTLLALIAAGTITPAFGSEAFLAPWPDREVWHHEGITREAAATAGFSDGAATDLAFHATYIDHYLNNPLWLASGGLARVRAARAVRADLQTLHFDDLHGPAAVQRDWRRCLVGTVCVLLWAAHAEPPEPPETLEPRGSAGSLRPPESVRPPHDWRTAVVRQAVGLGLHAVQDFASHSTWIDDPRRRGATWWEWRAAGGDVSDVVTGGVAHPGAVRHGDLGLRHGRQPVAVPLRGRWSTPRWLTGAGDGINLDTRWQARLGVRSRAWDGGELAPDEAFEVARAQAIRASIAWLEELGAVADRAGLAGLWEQVRTGLESERSTRAVRAAGARAFEDPGRRAHQFLAAGARPVTDARPDEDGEGWFLRIDAVTHAGRGRPVSRVLGPVATVPPSLPAPSTGAVRAVVAFRRGASDAEVRGYRASPASPVGRLALTEAWRARVAVPDPVR